MLVADKKKMRWSWALRPKSSILVNRVTPCPAGRLIRYQKTITQCVTRGICLPPQRLGANPILPVSRARHEAVCCAIKNRKYGATRSHIVHTILTGQPSQGSSLQHSARSLKRVSLFFELDWPYRISDSYPLHILRISSRRICFVTFLPSTVLPLTYDRLISYLKRFDYRLTGNEIPLRGL